MAAALMAWVLGAPGWLLLAAGVALVAWTVLWAISVNPGLPDDAEADEAIYRAW